MKRWVFTHRIEPAELEGVVSARYGGSAIFAAFSPVSGWVWVWGGRQEQVAEPEMVFVDPEWAKNHPRTSPVILVENPHQIKKKQTDQLHLL